VSVAYAPTPYVPPEDPPVPGAFVRDPYLFREWITADGASGYPAEGGRYHLYVSWACPWAQRVAIVRELLGLQDTIGLVVADPIRDDRGWRFNEEFPDSAGGFEFLSQAYLATDPGFDLRPTVPALWDSVNRRVVSNNFHDMTIMLSTQFDRFAEPTPDLYPADMRKEIDDLNEKLYLDVNNGVYRCGFAGSQEAYEEAFDRLFARLDELDERLGGQRFLMGDKLTDPDIRLFTTLVRFDAVYYVHFKCNLRRLVDYPNLWPYTRALYQLPPFKTTTDFDHIKRHYYMTHPMLNPSRIVPRGPEIEWDAPSTR